MQYQLLKLDDEFTCVDISDYKEPEPGAIFQIGRRLFQFIDVIESRLSRGVFGDIESPTWFRLRCTEVTGAKTRFAGADNQGMVLINLTNQEEA